jgi:hypothetical protein
LWQASTNRNNIQCWWTR